MKSKPTKEQLIQAHGKSVPDVIKPGLKILFCGINPGLYTAAIGCHFGRPGNRFWPALFAGGFTPRLFDPSEQRELIKLDLGITNLVNQATLLASELKLSQLEEGSRNLENKVFRFNPKIVAILGIDSYRKAFSRPQVTLGLQRHSIGNTKIWLLPNPSGLNAHYTPLKLAKLFRDMNDFLSRF